MGCGDPAPAAALGPHGCWALPVRRFVLPPRRLGGFSRKRDAFGDNMFAVRTPELIPSCWWVWGGPRPPDFHCDRTGAKPNCIRCVWVFAPVRDTGPPPPPCAPANRHSLTGIVACSVTELRSGSVLDGNPAVRPAAGCPLCLVGWCGSHRLPHTTPAQLQICRVASAVVSCARRWTGLCMGSWGRPSTCRTSRATPGCGRRPLHRHRPSRLQANTTSWLQRWWVAPPRGALVGRSASHAWSVSCAARPAASPPPSPPLAQASQADGRQLSSVALASAVVQRLLANAGGADHSSRLVGAVSAAVASSHHCPNPVLLHVTAESNSLMREPGRGDRKLLTAAAVIGRGVLDAPECTTHTPAMLVVFSLLSNLLRYLRVWGGSCTVCGVVTAWCAPLFPACTSLSSASPSSA